MKKESNQVSTRAAIQSKAGKTAQFLIRTTALCTAAVGLVAPALADSTATDPAAGGGATEGALQEIVVTAQRREESLEKTPIAVSVVGADALAQQQIVTEQDLVIAVPGLNVKAGLSSNQLNYAIRGQSLDLFSFTRPGVLPYFNEVQVGSNATSSGFYDLQSIQVLKGPQGTLFGRSATGGAVLLTSQKPTDEFGGYVDATIGDYDSKKYEAAINVPLIADTLLGRVAGFYESRNGYQYDTYTGGDVGGFDRYGIRGSLSLHLGAFKNDVVVDFASFNGGNTAAVLSSLVPTAAIPSSFLFAGGAVSDATFTQFALAEGAPKGTSLAGAWAAYVAAHPRTNANGIASVLANQLATGPFVVSSNGPNYTRNSNTIASDIATYDLTDDLQFKNVVGFVHTNTTSAADADGTPYTIDTPIISVEGHDYSEEAQLIGKAFDHNLTYVTGIYYSHEHEINNLESLLLELPPFVPTAPQVNSWTQEDSTYALYGQGTYDLTSVTGIEGLGATLGARYTSEKVQYKTQPNDDNYTAALANPAESTNQDRNSSNLSWTAGLQEQFNPNLLAYLVARRSYRDGGFNGAVAPYIGLGSSGGNAYATETLTDTELGLKFQGLVGSMPFRANIAGYIDWVLNDQRVAYTIVNLAPAAISVNVPRAHVEGIEFDGQINPLSWLQLGLSYNYTDAKFTDNVAFVQGTPTLFGTYPDTPKYSGSVFSQVTVPIHDTLSGTVRGEVYSQALSYLSSTANLNPGAVLPSYAITNFTAGVEDSKQGWSVNAVLKNAFNRVYYVGGAPVGDLLGVNSIVPGPPRTFAVELRYKF
jgi:iron complex outermembrane receptor protein